MKFLRKGSFILLCGSVLSGVPMMAPAQDSGPNPPPKEQLESLGKLLFFDKNLSVNRTQSCASCHDPGVGFSGPDSFINGAGAVEPGALPGRFGNRKPPAANYTGESPILAYDEEAMTWFGGMFWDGRATGSTLGDPLAEQAMGPFLNPLEMAMPNAREVVIRVAHSEYAKDFESVWGPGSLDFANDPNGSFERIARSLAAYERSDMANPYTSKFDLFWAQAKAAKKDITRITAAGIPGGMMGSGGGGMGGGGMMGGDVGMMAGGGGGGMGGGGMGGGGGGGPEKNPARWEHYQGLGLSENELKGLAIFNDPMRGNCASCHTLQEGAKGYPLFTDFGYYNLGIPRNPLNPFYTMPKKWNPDGVNWIDFGLGGSLKKAGYDANVYAIEMGKHKTPSLRNIDQRPYPEFVRAYGHNGYFKNLDQLDGIIHFYAWRAMMDANMGGRGMGPNPNMFPAPEVDQNRIKMQPFNFMMDGPYLVAFLKTLTDGDNAP